ncbi:sensor histidine kinase [Nocardioides sp.]|uniref:sensor histidine kinase n=1 Tax=Nocardioides sp. TaxID=35761 RepID=UPI003D0A52A4
MSERCLRIAAGVVVVVVFVLELASVVLSVGVTSLGEPVLYFVYAVTQAAAGALILGRYPRHRIGWLLVVFALQSAATADFALAYGQWAAGRDRPLSHYAELVGMLAWIFAAGGLVLLFLLFPDGHLPSRRWRVAVWIWGAGAVLALPGWTLNPRLGSEFADGVNPFAVDGFPAEPLFGLGAGLVSLALVLSVVALVVRLRQAHGVERDQLKWFASAAVVVAVVLPLSAALWTVWAPIQILSAAALMLLPVSACVAILRHQLYDVDLVIARTVAYVALSLVLAAAYAGIVLAVGAFVTSPVAAATAALVVAVVFRPLRDRVQQAVDRAFRPSRHRALVEMTDYVDALRHGRASSADIEEVFRRSLRDDRLELGFGLPAGEVLGADGTRGGRPRPGPGRTVTSLPTSAHMTVLISHRDEDARLVTDVADAGRLAVEIVALQTQLRQQMHELEASRNRILSVADEERRALARDLHDGAQQRLVSIGLMLRHAQRHQSQAAVSEVIDAAVAELACSIDELRELAGGLRPGSLDDGLGGALRELADRTPVPVDVSAGDDRFPAELESAAYFIACEGVTNAVKHAGASAIHVSVARERGALVVAVSDDGQGGADASRGSGLLGMADRARAHRGELSVQSSLGRGTRLEVRLPCA